MPVIPKNKQDHVLLRYLLHVLIYIYAMFNYNCFLQNENGRANALKINYLTGFALKKI